MKKGHGLERQVPIVEAEKLQSMSTKQLLGRLNKLRYCEESLQGSDLSPQEAASCAKILFKDTPEWKNAYGLIKAILATREHILKRSAR